MKSSFRTINFLIPWNHPHKLCFCLCKIGWTSWAESSSAALSEATDSPSSLDLRFFLFFFLSFPSFRLRLLFLSLDFFGFLGLDSSRLPVDDEESFEWFSRIRFCSLFIVLLFSAALAPLDIIPSSSLLVGEGSSWAVLSTSSSPGYRSPRARNLLIADVL